MAEPPREWGVLLKARIGPDATPAEPAQLEALLAALPGEDKRLTGGGRDFTIAWWVEATDAAAATRTGAAEVRAICATLGVADPTFVRAHAASVEERVAPLSPTDEDVRRGRWAVDIKVEMPDDGQRMTLELLDRVSAALPDPDAVVTLHGDLEKFLLDDGSGFTVRSWAAGATIEDACATARAAVLEALDAVGLWDVSLVRLKAWDAEALRGDLFPGAGSRTPRPTGELR